MAEDPAGVLAIVPAHDEGPRVGPVVRALVAQGLPVLVVDDGSSDDTGDQARAAGARVLSLQPNRGKGAALKAGFQEALRWLPGVAAAGAGGAGGRVPAATEMPGATEKAPPEGPRWEAILTLDGDGQHDPSEVPALLKAWKESAADLVVGVRDYLKMPPVRWFTNSVSRLLFSWAVGERIPDNQSGYRLRTRRVVEADLGSAEQGFAFEVEEIALCIGRRYKLAWVPIKTIYGTETSDIKAWSHFVSFMRVTRRARQRVREERGALSTRSGL